MQPYRTLFTEAILTLDYTYIAIQLAFNTLVDIVYMHTINAVLTIDIYNDNVFI